MHRNNGIWSTIPGLMANTCAGCAAHHTHLRAPSHCPCHGAPPPCPGPLPRPPAPAQSLCLPFFPLSRISWVVKMACWAASTYQHAISLNLMMSASLLISHPVIDCMHLALTYIYLFGRLLPCRVRVWPRQGPMAPQLLPQPGYTAPSPSLPLCPSHAAPSSLHEERSQLLIDSSY